MLRRKAKEDKVFGKSGMGKGKGGEGWKEEELIQEETR